MKLMKVLFLFVLMVTLSGFMAACSNADAPQNNEKPAAEEAAAETPKAEGEVASAEGATAAPAAANTNLSADKLIEQVKEMYICPRIDMSIKDAEEEGALCPQGQEIIARIQRIIDGSATEADILDFVQNYRIQGRALVNANGNQPCQPADKVKVEAFIMSYCPYGVKFVDDILAPMVSDFGPSLEWTPRYIMSSDSSGNLSSMHGQKEVDEDLRQICIRDKMGLDKWMEYMACFSPEIYAKSRTGDAKTWQYCAEQAGIDTTELQNCFDNEATQLAQKDIELAMAYGASGSPTAVYNCNKNIVGALPYERIKTAVCKMYTGMEPQTCN